MAGWRFNKRHGGPPNVTTGTNRGWYLDDGEESPGSRVKLKSHVIYVISFNDCLTKVGRTTNWQRRRKSLTHHATLKLVGEAVFHVEFEQSLEDAEAVALGAMRERFKTAGGREFFRTSFDEAFLVVQAALRSVTEDCIVGEQRVAIPDGPALSETTGDQLDAAIRAFCTNHGIGTQRVVRFIGAGKHTETIKRTGLVPIDVEERMRALMDRPVILFEGSPA